MNDISKLQRYLEHSSLYLIVRHNSTQAPQQPTGPLQLGSHDQIFTNFFIIYYGLYLKECQKWEEHIKNTEMATFEAPGIKE